MRTLLKYYNFPETWADVSPRLAELDKEVNLNIGLFTQLDYERSLVIDQDCLPDAVAAFMVKVSVALSYATVMAGRIACKINEYSEEMEKQKATKTVALNNHEDPAKRPKSDAALERTLNVDLSLIELKWSVEDLKAAHAYVEGIFKTLQKDAENWRARYYGAQSDRKLTPGINAPYTGDEPGMSGGLPPRIGGR